MTITEPVTQAGRGLRLLAGLFDTGLDVEQVSSMTFRTQGKLDVLLGDDPWPHRSVYDWARSIGAEVRADSVFFSASRGLLCQGLVVEAKWIKVTLYVDVEGPPPAEEWVR